MFGVSRFGENPKPTVIVRMEENGFLPLTVAMRPLFKGALCVAARPRPDAPSLGPRGRKQENGMHQSSLSLSSFGTAEERVRAALASLSKGGGVCVVDD